MEKDESIKILSQLKDDNKHSEYQKISITIWNLLQIEE